jgi:hypothetical protein
MVGGPCPFRTQTVGALFTEGCSGIESRSDGRIAKRGRLVLAGPKFPKAAEVWSIPGRNRCSSFAGGCDFWRWIKMLRC